MCTPKVGRLLHRGNSPEEYEGSACRSSYVAAAEPHSPREAGSSRGGGHVTPASWPQWLSPSQTVESGGRVACDSIPSGTEAPTTLTPCSEQWPCKDDNPRHSKGNLAPAPLRLRQGLWLERSWTQQKQSPSQCPRWQRRQSTAATRQ